MITATIRIAPDTLATLALDPRRFWYRAHLRAVAHVHRANAAYEHTWRSGQPAWSEWEQLRAANHRAAFAYWQLRAVMGW